MGKGEDTGAAEIVAGKGGKVLLLSMRRVERLVAYCIEYEFEDVIRELTDADRVDVRRDPLLVLNRRLYKYARLLTGSRGFARVAGLVGPRACLDRDYELFLPVFSHVYELPALAAVPDWRRRCRLAAAYVSEVWLHNTPRYLLELLGEFDHIFIGVKHSVAGLARLTGRPCTYLPTAADVIRFAPFPEPPARTIDVCNIGRRSAVTHSALLERARDPAFLYYYDTVAASGLDLRQRTFRVQDPREHRLLLASLLKRSRYYIANRGFINDPDSAEDMDEMSGRFYEGAAAGAVMVGVPPRTDEFLRQFNWPDAVIPLPFDSPDVGALLDALDAEPERLVAVRSANVRNAALRHDWGHRLRTIYDTLGLTASAAMLERERRLQWIAERAAAAGPPRNRAASG